MTVRFSVVVNKKVPKMAEKNGQAIKQEFKRERRKSHQK